MRADEIAQRLASLREAGTALRGRSTSELVDLLGSVLDGWSDPVSAWRRALEAELPAAVGFSEPMVREGLDRALSGWTGKALRELAQAELGSLDEGGGGPLLARSGATAVVLAGSIPMPTLLSTIAPLVLGSPVFAKSASRDRVTPPLVARSIAEVDEALGRCIEVVHFDSRDGDCARALFDAECVCAAGSDATIAAIRAVVRPPRRLVTDGHRLSVAAVAPAVGSALSDLAERLAVDVALWDQLGCLSPVCVYAVGGDASFAGSLADALAGALASAEARWPRGEIDPAAARDVLRERSEAELRRAAGRSVTLLASSTTAWTVVCEEDARLRPAPLHRFVRVVPVSDAADLLDAMAPLGSHLAGVAVEGFGGKTPELARALADLGASRVCAPGKLQSPPLAWRHAGRGVLAPLARFTDVETAG